MHAHSFPAWIRERPSLKLFLNESCTFVLISDFMQACFAGQTTELVWLPFFFLVCWVKAMHGLNKGVGFTLGLCDHGLVSSPMSSSRSPMLYAQAEALVTCWRQGH